MDDDSAAELEQRVSELEATVRGLTEELVDLSERVRQLEDGAPASTAVETSKPAEGASTEREDPHATTMSGGDSGGAETVASAEAAAEGGDGGDEDVLDADAHDPDPADGADTETAAADDESTDEGEDSDDSDDIIVA
ncbi:MAG: bZIP transcription factor [Halobacteriaceae archaeon]